CLHTEEYTTCQKTSIGTALGAFSHRVGLGLSARQCDRGHPLPRCPSTGDRFRRRGPYCAAPSTSDSSYGYAPLAPWQYVEPNRTNTTERWRESRTPASACSGARGAW